MRVRALAEALPVAASGSFRGKLLEDIEKERRKRKKLTLSSFFLGPLPRARPRVLGVLGLCACSEFPSVGTVSTTA